MINTMKTKTCKFGVATAIVALLPGSNEGLSEVAQPDKDKIIFIASNAVIPQDSLEGFYLGFEAAFISEFGAEATRNLLNKKFDYSNDPASIRRLAETAISGGAAALVGMPSSHELLLVGDLCKKSQILCMSTGAHHPGVSTFGATTHTIVRNLETDFMTLLSNASKRFPHGKGAIIVNDEAVFSLGNADLVQKVAGKIGGITTEKLHLTHDLKLSDRDIASIGSYDFIFLTLFPWGAESLLSQLASQHVVAPVFATSSWDAKSYLMLKGPLSRLATGITLPVMWKKNSSDSRKFEDGIMDRLGQPAMTEMALGYDAGKVVAEAIKLGPKNPNRSSLLQTVMTKDVCASETSAGRICVSRTGGYSTRQIIFAKMTGTSFSYVTVDP